MAKIPGPDSILWRFVAGQPLSGHYRTDAGFFRRGKTLLGRVPATRWSYLPGWQRSAVRLAVVALIPVGTWEYLHNPGRTVAVAALSMASLALWAVVRGFQAFRRRKTYRKYVKPLHAVLEPLLGLPADIRPHEYITVPNSFRKSEATPALIRLPKSFAPTQGNRDTISTVVLRKLELNEDNTDVIFRMVGDPILELKMAPQPPNSVMWDDFKELMDGLKPGEIFVGLGCRDKPYIRDYTSGELVHGGFSVQTGRGKSFAAMAWAAQSLHSDPGTLVTFIDPKQSHLPTCLVGVPGYRLANDPDNVIAMWDAIELFETEMDRRRYVRLENQDAKFPLMYLYLDELSEFADMTREQWEFMRTTPDQYGYESTAAMPKRAPIWRSLSRILRMSREYGGRVNVFTQRLDNASTGGIGLRDLFGWRGLAGFRKNQWVMLIDTTPIPKSQKRVGRWIYSDGHSEVWVQNVYGTPEQLREWAMAGRAHVDTQGGHTATSGSLAAVLPPSAQWDIVGLQAAADYLDIPVGTFRKRRARHAIDGEGNVGRSPAWMTETLDKWGKVDA